MAHEPMTLRALAAAILALPAAQQDKTATVYPPQGCPASERVPVTALLLVGGSENDPGDPVISTGKKPT
jgi:hypothetical protein